MPIGENVIHSCCAAIHERTALASQLEARALASSGSVTWVLESSYNVIKQLIERLIIMRWIVMKSNNPPRTNQSRKFERLPISAVSPSDAALILRVCSR